VLCQSKQKTFWRGTPAELAANADKIMDDMGKMMDEQLSGIPAEQRDMLKQAMKEQVKPGQIPRPKAEVIDTGLTDTLPTHSTEIRNQN